MASSVPNYAYQRVPPVLDRQIRTNYASTDEDLGERVSGVKMTAYAIIAIVSFILIMALSVLAEYYSPWWYFGAGLFASILCFDVFLWRRAR
jgi:hypothetical protein